MTLEDAFDPGRYEAGNYTPAGKAQAVEAIAIDVSCYDEEQGLEFRFAAADGYDLSVSIAFDLNSPEADTPLEFAVYVDGRRTRTKTISFKQSAELKVPLTGVARVRIVARVPESANSRECNDSLRGLITRIAMNS